MTADWNWARTFARTLRQDYAWQGGGSPEDERVRSLARTLGGVFERAPGRGIVAVVRGVGERWYVMSVRTGVEDNSGRMSYRLDVWERAAPGPLEPRRWMPVADHAIEVPSDAIASGFQTPSPAPAGSAELLDDDTRRCLDLGSGVPVSAEQANAWLERECADVYSGLVFTRSGPKGLVAPAAGLEGLLLVGFSGREGGEEPWLPELRRLSADEWTGFSTLQPAEARRLLASSADAPTPSLPGPAGEALVAWSVARLIRNGQSSREALERVSRISGLTERVIRAAAPTLTPAAVAALCGGKSCSASEAWGELAAAGLLGIVDRRCWWAAGSADLRIADFRDAELGKLGLAPAEAAFLCDNPAGGLTPSAAAGLRGRLRLQNVPLPTAAFESLLEMCHDEHDLKRCTGLAEAFPPEGEALASLMRGGVPAAGALPLVAWGAALDARARAHPSQDVFLPVAKTLRSEGRTSELLALLPRIPSELSGALRTELLGGDPIDVEATTVLQPWARAGLFSAKSLRPRNRESLAELARCYPEARPFAIVLGAEGTVPTDYGGPSEWWSRARDVVSAADLVRWLDGIGTTDFPDALAWLRQLPWAPTSLRHLFPEEASEAGPPFFQAVDLWVRPLQPLRRATFARWFLSGVKGRFTEEAACFVAGVLVGGANTVDSDFVVHALSGIGSLPRLGTVDGGLLRALLPRLDTPEVVGRLLAEWEPIRPEVAEAVLARASMGPSPTLAPRYTRAQLQRHRLFIDRLAQVSGWEELRAKPGDQVHALSLRVLAEGLDVELLITALKSIQSREH